jgi:hypothetical protein
MNFTNQDYFKYSNAIKAYLTFIKHLTDNLGFRKYYSYI